MEQTQEIIKGNKLIAEFHGWESQPLAKSGQYSKTLMWNFPDWHKASFTIDSMKYHISWDWLMPVVEKISHYRLAHPEQANRVCDCKIVIAQSRLWELCVEFCRWLASVSPNKEGRVE